MFVLNAYLFKIQKNKNLYYLLVYCNYFNVNPVHSSDLPYLPAFPVF